MGEEHSSSLDLFGDVCCEGSALTAELSSELALANLEGPLLGHTQPDKKPKAGPHLYSCRVPKFASREVFAIANNHIMDYGERGLRATQGMLRAAGCLFLGAGRDVSEARAARIIPTLDGRTRIAIVACCEAQFGSATLWSPGVAEDDAWVFSAILKLRDQADSVIVSVHGGAEDVPFPSPSRKVRYRAWIDAGASVVHGHHAHMPQSYEMYNGGLITYGLGNFIVHPDAWKNKPNGLWSIAFGIKRIAKPVEFDVRITVCEASVSGIHVRYASLAEEAERAPYLARINALIHDPKLHEAVWQEVSMRAYRDFYMPNLGWREGNTMDTLSLGLGERLKAPLRGMREALAGKRVIWKGRTGRDLIRYHLLACEAHRNMIRTALGILSGEIVDRRNERSKAYLTYLQQAMR